MVTNFQSKGLCCLIFFGFQILFSLRSLHQIFFLISVVSSSHKGNCAKNISVLGDVKIALSDTCKNLLNNEKVKKSFFGG
jgi:hypothetical protein